MKRFFKVGQEYFENKMVAKKHRNTLEDYTPVIDKETGLPKPDVWKHEVKRGPDHWKGSSK